MFGKLKDKAKHAVAKAAEAAANHESAADKKKRLDAEAKAAGELDGKMRHAKRYVVYYGIRLRGTAMRVAYRALLADLSGGSGGEDVDVCCRRTLPPGECRLRHYSLTLSISIVCLNADLLSIEQEVTPLLLKVEEMWANRKQPLRRDYSGLDNDTACRVMSDDAELFRVVFRDLSECTRAGQVCVAIFVLELESVLFLWAAGAGFKALLDFHRICRDFHRVCAPSPTLFRVLFRFAWMLL